jgi:hypothetical protein
MGIAAAGTGVGAASGAGAGALGGAAVGGHAAADALDPTVETNYWRQNYKTSLYYKQGKAFGDYEAAYRYGWENAVAKKDLTFEEAEKFHLLGVDSDGTAPALHRFGKE